MPKRISYKNVSEKQTYIIQTLKYDYESLKKEVTILKNKLNIYEPYMDIIIKYNISDTNMLEDKLKIKKRNDAQIENEKIDVNILNKEKEEQQIYKLNIKNNVDIESDIIENNIIDNIKINPKDNNNKSEIKKVYENVRFEKENIENSINNNNTNTINDNSINIEIASKDKNQDEIINYKDISSDDKSENNKVKISTSIIERIKSFYYKNDDTFNIKYDGSVINNLKNEIQDNYDTINKNKSEIIYNYYKLYKKYLEAKENDNKLSFNNFVDYNTKDINRYNEKVKRCYLFFNSLINIVRDVPGFYEYSKINIIIDILSKCRLSIDKLYKIRNDNYNILIDFLNPILIEECKKQYETDKD